MRVSRSNDDLMALKQEIERELELISDCDDPQPTKYAIWEMLSPRQQFAGLTATMFLFFGIHNVLQEAMMKVPGFHGVMLSYMEVVG